MLEQVDLELTASKADYKKRLPELQRRLYDLHHAIFTNKVPMVVVFEGWAASGKGSTINALTEQLDARGFRVVPVAPPRTTETHYPWMWRFWQRVPARGQMVILDTSWYRRVLVDRVAKTVKRREWTHAFQDIAEFEEQLAADGTVMVKFWLHISKQEQSRRFKKLLKNKFTAWQVTEEDAAQHKAYDKYLSAAEEMLARTDSPNAPWIIVEATNKYHTRLKVYETLIRLLEAKLGVQPQAKAEANSAGKRKGKSTKQKEAAHA
jgi:polyphosphate kinase 2 (PPK2 family)